VFSDEQERVQKKTFTNWMNTYLRQVSYLPLPIFKIASPGKKCIYARPGLMHAIRNKKKSVI